MKITTKIAKNGVKLYYVDGKRTSREVALQATADSRENLFTIEYATRHNAYFTNGENQVYESTSKAVLKELELKIDEYHGFAVILHTIGWVEICKLFNKDYAKSLINKIENAFIRGEYGVKIDKYGKVSILSAPVVEPDSDDYAVNPDALEVAVNAEIQNANNEQNDEAIEAEFTVAQNEVYRLQDEMKSLIGTPDYFVTKNEYHAAWQRYEIALAKAQQASRRRMAALLNNEPDTKQVAELSNTEPDTTEPDEPKFQIGKSYYIKDGDSYYVLKVEARTDKMLTGTTPHGTCKYHIHDTFRGEYIRTHIYDDCGNREMIWAANEYKPQVDPIIIERDTARNEYCELNEIRKVIEKDCERFEGLRDRCKAGSPKHKEYNQLLESFDPIIRAFGEKFIAAQDRYNQSLTLRTDEERAATQKAIDEHNADLDARGIKYFATVYYYPNGIEGEDMETFHKDCTSLNEANAFVSQEDHDGVYVGGIYDAGWEITDRNDNLIADHITGIKEESQMQNFEWYTPSTIINAARQVFTTIDLDPASCALANLNVKAKKFYTAHDDGLTQDWFGNVWLNPPYSRNLIEKFADKVISQYLCGNINSAIVLTGACTETKWFVKLDHAADVTCFLTGRVKFLQPDGTPCKDNFRNGSCLFYFGTDLKKFFSYI